MCGTTPCASYVNLLTLLPPPSEPGVGGSWTTYWNLDWTLKDEITDILERGIKHKGISKPLLLSSSIPSDPEFRHSTAASEPEL